MAPFAADNEALQANLKALQAGRGAERELHNAGYAAQGEKMLIIIPKKWETLAPPSPYLYLLAS